MFWGSFSHFPTTNFTWEWLFILASLLPAPIQLEAHNNFKPFNCNQISGSHSDCRDPVCFNCSVFSFINAQQQGTNRCENQMSSRSIWFLLVNIIHINFICQACLELVGKTKLKYICVWLRKSLQICEDKFKLQIFMSKMFTQLDVTVKK